MVARLFRVFGPICLIVFGVFVPALVTPAPASAQTVIDGCSIVSNPSPTNFTDCPGASLGGADLAGVDLAYANLSGASFLTCYTADLINTCLLVNGLENADLSDANLSDTTFFNPGEFDLGPVGSVGGSAPSIDLSGANLSGADLAGADIDALVDFSGANLSGADLAGDTLADTFTNANLSGANLAGADAEYTVATLTLPATFTGANFTNTILVPPNQTVTATSQSGAVVTWSTPSGIPGATPGSCSPASGSTFPLFTTTVTCQVLDADNDVATGTFEVIVEPTTQYFTRVFVPSNGATLSGQPYLDAGASDVPGISKVVFELSGGTLNDQIISTATPTIIGWAARWNSTTVPNGSYTLQSRATDADNDVDTSTPVSITVNNSAPATAVVLPADNASLSGNKYLDATAGSGVSTVVYEVSGGPSDLNDQVVATATLTYVGWAAAWNTTGVPDGAYTLQSVASYAGGVSGTSAGVSITVAN